MSVVVEQTGVVTVGRVMGWAAIGVMCSGPLDHRKRGIIGFIGIMGGPGNMTPIVGGIPGNGAIKPFIIKPVIVDRSQMGRKKETNNINGSHLG